MSDLLLQEEQVLDTFEVLTEGAEKRPFLRGIIGYADKVNKNNRVYPKEVMKEAIEEIKPKIEKRAFLGQLGHPNTPKINEEKISHYFTKIEMASDGAVLGELHPTSGYYGKMLESLLRDGISLGLSSRATGSLIPYSGPLSEGQKIFEVKKGTLKFFAWDVVAEPSVSIAYPEVVTESEKIILGSSKKFREVWESCFK